MNDENLARFVIDVGTFMHVHTPYSNYVFKYDNIEDCLEDIKYCLECEVRRNVKKSNAEKKG